MISIKKKVNSLYLIWSYPVILCNDDYPNIFFHVNLRKLSPTEILCNGDFNSFALYPKFSNI